jgi:hypoxanthine phosphoribosyltransferase
VPANSDDRLPGSERPEPSPDPQRCEVIGLDEVYELAFQLSQSVRSAGYQPDLVIAIARGGFVPARLVCDFLRCRDLTSITVRHYAPGARMETAARITYPIGADLRGEKVLVVDDVNDTGETLELVRPHLEDRDAAEVRVAVLHEKARSQARADFRAAAVSDALWLVYEWALVEDTTGFLERLEPRPDRTDECRRRLEREFGLSLDDMQWKRVLHTMEHPPT